MKYHRYLRQGEIIQPGDEFEFGEKWGPCKEAIGSPVSTDLKVFRRTVEVDDPRDATQAALVKLQEAYDELIYAVARKFPNETRHQTALRYIQEAEQGKDWVSVSKPSHGLGHI
jgi:hypothetical protein